MDARVHRVWCTPRNIPLHSSELWRAEIQSFARVNQTGPARSESPLFKLLSASGKYLSNGKQTWAGRTARSARQHVAVGRAALYQWLQPDPARPGGAGIYG